MRRTGTRGRTDDGRTHVRTGGVPVPPRVRRGGGEEAADRRPMVRAVLATAIGDWRQTLKLTDLPPLPDIPPPVRACMLSARPSAHSLSSGHSCCWLEFFVLHLLQGALKIQVSACGMGFPDLLQSADKYQVKAEPPFVPVQYAVGTIVAIGESASSGDTFSYDGVFQLGDRVVANAAEDSDGHLRGGLAEEALVKADSANIVPASMSDAVALSMHENYWDTHHGVAVCGEVGPDDTLMVLGASGACGLAAIDLGKALGATVIACASSDEKLKACAAQGADILVNCELMIIVSSSRHRCTQSLGL